MTGGFWKGLLHGVVVSVIGLGTFSLLMPQTAELKDPDTAVTTTPAKPESGAQSRAGNPAVQDITDVGATGEMAADVSASTQQSAMTDPVAPDPTGNTDRPQAANVDLPAGSEFGRGSDAAPQYPEALSRHSPESRPVPLTVSPHADSSASIMREPADMRPQSRLPQRQSEPPQADMIVVEPDLPEPQSTPGATAAPDLAGLEAPDRLPDTASSVMTTDESDSQIQVEEENSQENTAPALVAPALDLSTPPDLSELRALERE